MAEVIVADETVYLPTLAGLQEQLLAGFVSAKAVTLDVSRVVRADLGFVQLIGAARVYARGRGVSFALAAPAPAPVEALLRRAGFVGDPASDDTAFWLQGAAR